MPHQTKVTFLESKWALALAKSERWLMSRNCAYVLLQKPLRPTKRRVDQDLLVHMIAGRNRHLDTVNTENISGAIERTAGKLESNFIDMRRSASYPESRVS